MSHVSVTGARRPRRINVPRRRRPAVSRAQRTLPSTRSMRGFRARRASTVGNHIPASRIRAVGPQLPLRIDVVRTVLLLAGALLAVLVALPALLESAAAPFN